MDLFRIQKKKGISPIIATLLLILIAVGAGVILYGYVVGFIGSSIQNGTAPPIETLTIPAWVIASNGSTVTIYVQNTGQSSINVTSAYFYTSSGALWTQNTTLAGYGASHGTGISISPGQTGTIYVKVATGFVKNSFYQAKVTTVNGGTAVTILQKA